MKSTISLKKGAITINNYQFPVSINRDNNDNFSFKPYMYSWLTYPLNTLLISILIYFYTFPAFGAIANTIQSPVNGMIITTPEGENGYKFIVAGHLYGAYANQKSIYPSSSLLANIDKLTSIKAAFFISLGDNYRNLTNNQLTLFKTSFLDRLRLPTFISPGNHDRSETAQYKNAFGPPYYTFILNNDLFLILNTNLPNEEISGNQKRLFLSALENAENNHNIKNLFIFTHRPIWAIEKPLYETFIKNSNAGLLYKTSKFKTEILPTLKRVAMKKRIYWGSGDIGNAPSLPLFYQFDTKDNITYFATGMGDTPQDSIVVIHVDSDSNVSLEAISLTSNKHKPISHYNLSYWNGHYQAEIRFLNKLKKERFWKYYFTMFLTVIKHKFFYTGITLGFLISIIIFMIGIMIYRKISFRNNA